MCNYGNDFGKHRAGGRVTLSTSTCLLVGMYWVLVEEVVTSQQEWAVQAVLYLLSLTANDYLLLIHLQCD